MLLSDFLTPEAVVPALKATSKKQALLEMSDRAATLTGLAPREIFDALLQRERLGSTGVGNGVAIPRGIDFDAIDSQPVDLIFVLLAPEGAGADHLRALSRIARLLRESGTVQRLRGTRDAAALYSVLCGETTSHAA